MNGTDYVAVIGGANIDINGFSEKPLIMGDSNPGKTASCPGGVGRNIAENLGRLGVDVRLISAIGNDLFGEQIVRSCKEAGVDLGGSLFPQESSSIYLALMDDRGEMALALSDMRILEKLGAAQLRKKRALIGGAAIIVMDTNLCAGAITYLVSTFKDRPLFLDPVSVSRARKVKPLIGSFHTLKLSRLEAEYLSGINISGPPSLERIGEHFIGKGVERIFITLGGEGVYVHSKTERFFHPVCQVRPLNVTGAGDAFMAGIVYGTLHGYADIAIAGFASAMAALTVQSADTVSKKISVNSVNKLTNNLKEHDHE